MHQISEAELLADVARGDTEAFSELYDRLADVLFSLAVKILHDTETAEDVLQEVFVQIWEKAATYDPKLGKLIAWAATLTRNRAITHLRASQRKQRLFDPAVEMPVLDDIAADVPIDPVISEETALVVRTALANLAPEQRRAIELAFFGGLTQTEIAATTQTPLGTVKARIRRGMLELRESLEVVL